MSDLAKHLRVLRALSAIPFVYIENASGRTQYYQIHIRPFLDYGVCVIRFGGKRRNQRMPCPCVATSHTTSPNGINNPQGRHDLERCEARPLALVSSSVATQHTPRTERQRG